MSPKTNHSSKGSNDPEFGKILTRKYKSKCNKYKRKLKGMQDELQKLKQQHEAHEGLRLELQQLKDQIKRDEVLNNSYYDTLEAHGLICGVCLEEVVQSDGLSCCNNKLCQSCEKQVAQKHRLCPFCRASMAPEQPPEQQQKQQVDDALAEQQPPNGLQGPAAHAWAAIQALLAARRNRSSSYTVDSEDEAMGSEGYSDFDEDADDDDTGDAAAHGHPDTTVLMAAAAEAMYAARRTPEGTCGLCGSNYLMSALATAEQLPDVLLCRSCWRNIPDLAGQQFPEGMPSGRSLAGPATPAAADGQLQVPAANSAGPAAAAGALAYSLTAGANNEQVGGTRASGMNSFDSRRLGNSRADAAGGAGAEEKRNSKKKRKRLESSSSGRGGARASNAVLPRRKRGGSIGSEKARRAAGGSAAAGENALASKKHKAQHKPLPAGTISSSKKDSKNSLTTSKKQRVPLGSNDLAAS